MKEEKIAVCITAQTSSQRLIDYGAEIAEQYNSSLHILHVQKGDSIFQNGETLKLLTKLLSYGDRCGGIVHVLCDEDVPMGELPKMEKKHTTKVQKETQFQKIINALPKDIEVIIAKHQQTIQTELKQKIG